MGMFDDINGEQVKCFYVPLDYFHNKEEKYDTIGHMGGLLRYFNTGDKVPARTGWYNYGDDFLIVDAADGDFVCTSVLHVILNGMVNKTYELYEGDEFPDIDFSKIKKVIDYSGYLLNIKSKEDVLDYLEKTKEENTKLFECIRKYNPEWKKFMEAVKANDAEGIKAWQEKDKARNEELIEIRKITKDYFINDPDMMYKAFGDIMECFNKAYNLNEEPVSIKDVNGKVFKDTSKKEKLGHLKFVFNDFISKNKDFNIDDYFKWAEMGEDFNKNISFLFDKIKE